MCTPLSSKCFTEFVGKSFENWSIFSEDMEKCNSLVFLGHPVSELYMKIYSVGLLETTNVNIVGYVTQSTRYC